MNSLENTLLSRRLKTETGENEMSGFRLSVDPAALSPRALGDVISDLRSRPNAQAFLGRSGRSVSVTDNPSSPSLSAANRVYMRSLGEGLAGFAQENATPNMVYINLEHWKPAINILVHELLHHATRGNDAVKHGKRFYRELMDVLISLEIDFNSDQDLGGNSIQDLKEISQIYALHASDADPVNHAFMPLQAGLRKWAPVAALGLSLVALAATRTKTRPSALV